ncbi:MAG: phosphoglycolate phosphatase, partial [Zoogloeaceae bacterium]|nr:phosphoglycolate phosphatase [Zoogloeaceae bacterium]
MSFDLIAFDLDGTLLDTVPDIAAACVQMMGALGLPELPTADIRRFVGQGTGELVRQCLAEVGAPTDADALDQALAAFRTAYEAENGVRASVFAGVAEGLEKFAASGLPLIVVTNKPTQFSLPLLDQTGLAPFFRFAVCGDTTPYKKPHPEPLLYACRRLDVAPERLLLIGDSINDARAARAARAQVVLVTYGYADSAPVSASDC